MVSSTCLFRSFRFIWQRSTSSNNWCHSDFQRGPQNFPRGERGNQQTRSYASFQQLCIYIHIPGFCHTMSLEEKSQKITYQEHCLSVTTLFTTQRYLLQKPTFKWVICNIQHQCLLWLLIQFMVNVNPTMSRDDVFFCLIEYLIVLASHRQLYLNGSVSPNFCSSLIHAFTLGQKASDQSTKQ